MEDKKSDIFKSTMRKMACIGWLHRAVFERNISKMGIHHSQHYLLMHIAKENEIPSQKQLAEKFGISPAAVARSLKALESEGYIERTSDLDDSRLKKIVITEKGREIIRKTHRMFKETDESIFESFDDADIEKLNEYLDTIQSRLVEKNEENQCVREENEKEQD